MRRINRGKVLAAAGALMVVAAAIFFMERAAHDVPVAGPDLNSEKGGRGGPMAPEIGGASLFLNSPEFSLEDLRGRVVMIDFWTYSCINCIRTQPYLNAWHEKYAGDGLVIVGVHTPEFQFEKDPENVRKAVSRAGIKYPVVLDNEYAVWNAYRNRWWPRKFLIDIDGFIRYDHIGEGAYEKTEMMIQQLLKERSDRTGLDLAVPEIESAASRNFRVGTPEIYFGYRFARGNLGNSEGFNPENITSYKRPEKLKVSKAYLSGEWLNKAGYSELVSGTGSVALVYRAKNVNIVAGSVNGSEIEVFVDGKRSPFNETVREEKLYRIVQGSDPGERLVEISAKKGFRIYTFTFG